MLPAIPSAGFYAMPDQQPASPPSSQLDSTYKPLLLLVALGFFMQSLDATIVNTALPAMARSLGESPLHMQAVVVAYVLSVAAVIPASGWLAERFGLRNTFLSAVIIFSVASLGCALSQNLDQLVIARVFQGIGGALLLPVGRLAILKALPRRQLLAAMSFITVPGLAGQLIGPSLGGLLVEFLSWHAIFLINLPIGILGVLMTLKVMPIFQNPAIGKFDSTGYILLIVAMLCLSLSLDGLADKGMAHASMFILLVMGMATVVAYCLHAVKKENALFRASLFHNHTFSIGIFGNLFARLGGGAIPFMLPLLLQLGLGYAPLQAGLMMIPMVLGAMGIKRFISPLIQRFGYRQVLVTNTLLVGLGIASFALIQAGTPGWVHVVHLFVFGMINSVQFTSMNTLTIKDLDDQHASSGNSLLSMIMMLSMSMGVAISSAILNGFIKAFERQHVLEAFHATFVCIGLITMAAAWIFAQLATQDKRCETRKENEAGLPG
jgi:DHA2 family multidrug resistance protein-like MFS transporter